MHFVYALYSPDHNKIYIGESDNLITRMKYHNHLAEKGYTKSYRPWILIYQEQCVNRSEARKREKQLKSGGGRRFIWGIVHSHYASQKYESGS